MAGLFHTEEFMNFDSDFSSANSELAFPEHLQFWHNRLYSNGFYKKKKRKKKNSLPVDMAFSSAIWSSQDPNGQPGRQSANTKRILFTSSALIAKSFAFSATPRPG